MPLLEEERLCTEGVRIAYIQKPCYQRVKRIFDFACSLISLVILCPVLLVIALIVFLDDPHGSPLFSQIRVGKDGKTFRIYKFRTMVVNAEQAKSELIKYNEMDGPVFKLKNDPRITRVGGFLRKTALDELPQLYNVLKGEMSFVGPRPPLPEEVREYTPHQQPRLLVPPGMTCIWQVMPNRNSIPFSRWMEMDLEYVENRSIWLDLKLILKTPAAMLHKNGQ